MSLRLPDRLPSTPATLYDAAPTKVSPADGELSPVQGLVNEDQMQNAFTELKKSIVDMDSQLSQFEFVLDHMRSNMVRVNESTGEVLGEFDEDDIALWEADAEKVRRLKTTFETDFGKRIYVYEKKIQDANGIVKRRMQFFNDVNDRFDLLRKRPELMKRMARKQAELIATLSETQRVLLRDMHAAVARYNKEKAVLSSEPLLAPPRQQPARLTPSRFVSATPPPDITRHFKEMSLQVSRPGSETSVHVNTVNARNSVVSRPPGYSHAQRSLVSTRVAANSGEMETARHRASQLPSQKGLAARLDVVTKYDDRDGEVGQMLGDNDDDDDDDDDDGARDSYDEQDE